MLLLGFESSAKTAGVALMRDGLLIAEDFQNNGLTHSKTLLPMADELLKAQGLVMADIDVFAVAHGPGSFTGVRIGVACVKGLCWATDKPAVGVSTLEAMAYNGTDSGAVICCCMDARRNEVYNAFFEFEAGKLVRLCPDRAISLEALGAELGGRENVLLIGDGAELAYEYLKDIADVTLAAQEIRLQRGTGVCLAAAGKMPTSGADLIPVYLRLSQAERERQVKNK